MKNPNLHKRNPKPGTCCVLYCSRKVEGSKLCGPCRSMKSRLSDPVRYAYQNMKDRAKQRWKGQGKPFTITLVEFREWCHKVNYVGFARGRRKDSYTVDCIVNELGYVPGNLQLLTRSENTKKYFAYDYRTKQVTLSAGETFATDTDLPF